MQTNLYFSIQILQMQEKSAFSESDLSVYTDFSGILSNSHNYSVTEIDSGKMFEEFSWRKVVFT